MYKLQKSETALEFPDQLIRLAGPDEPEIVSVGQPQWKFSLKQPDGEWLYHETQLLPLYKDFFMTVSVFEHSRGANIIEILTLFDRSGKKYWENIFEGYHFNKCLINESEGTIVLRNTYPKEKHFAFIKGYCGTDIVIFQLENFKEISRYYLCYPIEKVKAENRLVMQELIELISWNGISSAFEENDGKIGIQIKMSDFGKSKMPDIEPVFYEISAFLKTAPQKSEPGAAPPA